MHRTSGRLTGGRFFFVLCILRELSVISCFFLCSVLLYLALLQIEASALPEARAAWGDSAAQAFSMAPEERR
jgi:hypothetical protein